MPLFKSTYNILTNPAEDEVFDPNWMDSDKLVLPPKKNWDYKRELTIEDVDIWEILYEGSYGLGLYAAWSPYAEFYMMTTGWKPMVKERIANERKIETFYGPQAQQKIIKRIKELNLDIRVKFYDTWVDEEDMWIHKKSN